MTERSFGIDCARGRGLKYFKIVGTGGTGIWLQKAGASPNKKTKPSRIGVFRSAHYELRQGVEARRGVD